MKLSEVKKYLFESLTNFCEENNFKVNKGNFKISSKSKEGEFGITFLENHVIDRLYDFFNDVPNFWVE
jgi:hypothetical protein